MSYINKYSGLKRRGFNKHKGIKNAYSNKSSPILTGIINVLILILIFILVNSCLNILKNYNDINKYKAQLEAMEINKINGAVEVSTAGTVNTIEEKREIQATLPTILPCQGTITSKFGGRTLSISRGKSEFHYGLDISNPIGTEIKASADGTVEFAGYQNGYGNVVFIKHDGTYTTIYGHCSKLLVRKGDAVKRGQVIALVGNTGRSTGPHVHFEIRVNNKAVNPQDIVKN